MRYSILACVVLAIMCSTVRSDALGSCASHVEPLREGALTIKLPSGWDTKRAYDFEDEVYIFGDKGAKMFFADFGNNPDLVGLRRDANVTSVMLNGQNATEFRKRMALSDVIVELRCGGYKYVWLHVITKNQEKLPDIYAAMGSLACEKMSWRSGGPNVAEFSIRR